MAHGPVFNHRRVAELTRRHGLTSTRLAHLAQASPRSVRRWITGEATPPPYSLSQLAQALGVAPTELLAMADGAEPNLRYLRMVGGFSLALLASETGLAGPYLHRVEAGKAQLTPAAAQQIAAALGVDVQEVTTAALRTQSTRRGNSAPPPQGPAASRAVTRKLPLPPAGSPPISTHRRAI